MAGSNPTTALRASILDLPDELLLKIFQQLSAKREHPQYGVRGLHAVVNLCRHFKRIAEPLIWTTFALECIEYDCGMCGGGPCTAQDIPRIVLPGFKALSFRPELVAHIDSLSHNQDWRNVPVWHVLQVWNSEAVQGFMRSNYSPRFCDAVGRLFDPNHITAEQKDSSVHLAVVLVLCLARTVNHLEFEVAQNYSDCIYEFLTLCGAERAGACDILENMESLQISKMSPKRQDGEKSLSTGKRHSGLLTTLQSVNITNVHDTYTPDGKWLRYSIGVDDILPFLNLPSLQSFHLSEISWGEEQKASISITMREGQPVSIHLCQQSNTYTTEAALGDFLHVFPNTESFVYELDNCSEYTGVNIGNSVRSYGANLRRFELDVDTAGCEGSILGRLGPLRGHNLQITSLRTPLTHLIGNHDGTTNSSSPSLCEVLPERLQFLWTRLNNDTRPEYEETRDAQVRALHLMFNTYHVHLPDLKWVMLDQVVRPTDKNLEFYGFRKELIRDTTVLYRRESDMCPGELMETPNEWEEILDRHREYVYQPIA